MQITVVWRVAATPSVSLSLPHKSLKRRNMKKRGVKEQVTTEYLLLSVLLLPNLTERWVSRVGYWQGLSLSLSLFFFPRSPSLN